MNAGSPNACRQLSDAPAVNFATWRDAEGRLIWGVNDFDRLGRRKSTWLTKAAEHMGEAVTRDWRQWRK